MEDYNVMILMTILIGGFLFYHLLWVYLKKFFLTINLDFENYFITCLWSLGLILFLFEMIIGLIFFVIISPYYFAKKLYSFLKNIEEIPETETYNCY